MIIFGLIKNVTIIIKKIKKFSILFLLPELSFKKNNKIKNVKKQSARINLV